MSKKKETGSAAFPSTPAQWDCGMEGMTLRDYFAAAALTGLLAHPRSAGDPPLSYSGHVAIAYYSADVMLKERGKE